MRVDPSGKLLYGIHVVRRLLPDDVYRAIAAEETGETGGFPAAFTRRVYRAVALYADRGDAVLARPFQYLAGTSGTFLRRARIGHG